MAIGGGQVIVGLDVNEPQPLLVEGPATTVAFEAHQLQAGSNAATGEVQEVDTGRGRSVYHGRVTCMVLDGNEAVLLYRPREEFAPEDEIHQLYVRDNGDGAQDDTVIIDRVPAQPCVLAKPTGPELEFGRGNVQLHDAD